MSQRRIAYRRLVIAGLVSLGLTAAACGGTEPVVRSAGEAAAHEAGTASGSYGKAAGVSAAGGTSAVGGGYGYSQIDK